LLLRGFVGLTLISQTISYVTQLKVSPLGWIVIGLSLASAACLLAGLLTPVVSSTVASGASLLAIAGFIFPPFEVIVPAITIALLGPGAFSLDARMFGRREILVPHTSRSAKS
jgi:uncharacterized membrane protein YphA (DoxX/SURF4 family)